jgi:hypothetical protein
VADVLALTLGEKKDLAELVRDVDVHDIVLC